MYLHLVINDGVDRSSLPSIPLFKISKEIFFILLNSQRNHFQIGFLSNKSLHCRLGSAPKDLAMVGKGAFLINQVKLKLKMFMESVSQPLIPSTYGFLKAAFSLVIWTTHKRVNNYLFFNLDDASSFLLKQL